MARIACVLCAACVLIVCSCGESRRQLDSRLAAARDSLRRGELNRSEKQCDVGLEKAEKASNPQLAWEFRLLRCEAWLQNNRAKQIPGELNKALPGGPDYRVIAARRKLLEGEALLAQGLERNAGDVLEVAHQLAVASGNIEAIVDVEVGLGALLLHQARWEDAEKVLRYSLQQAESAHLTYQAAGALIDLGMSRVDRNRYDEAIPYFERAARSATSRLATLYNVAQSNLATCFNNLGEPERAIEIEERSITQHERSGARLYLQSALGEAGHTLQQIGDDEKAARYLERALQVAKEIGSNRNAAIWAGNLSIAYSDRGDWSKAENFNNEAIRIKNSTGIRTVFYNTMNAARIAGGKGQREESGRLYREALLQTNDPAVLWEAHGELGRLAEAQGKQDEAIREFEAAVTVVEQKRAELLATDYKLPFLSRLIRLYQWYVDALVQQGNFDRALAVADSSRAQTLVERFDSNPQRQLGANAFTRTARSSGASILTYWLGPRESHAWLITPRRVEHVTLAPEGEILPLVEDYRLAIETRQVDPLRSRVPSGEKLFDLLVKPVREWIPAGSRLIIVPDGVLSGLNFESLPVAGAVPQHYWIEDVSIAVAPSINVLTKARTAAARGSGLLAIGDADSMDRNYPPLANAALEIGRVSGHYRDTSRIVKQKDAAVPAAYADSHPSRFDAIHFTAHAVANRASPLDSAVLLTGGKLYARDILNIPLRASLVTLSACRGAGSRLYNGEGLVGFAWAFLHAGAQNVIAGLWDVNDQSTAGLMDTVYSELVAGRTPSEALRKAKLEMIHSPSNFRKPYYWAAFQTYTTGGMAP